MEQKAMIDLIYKMLSEVEKMRQLEGVPHEAVIMMASRVCELMLEYIYSEKGLIINDLGIVERADKNKKHGHTYTPLTFVKSFTKEMPEVLPLQCIDFLNIIRVNRNKAAHAAMVSEEEYIAFFNAFICFRRWFDIEYIEKDSSILLNKDEIQEKITSLHEESKRLQENAELLARNLRYKAEEKILEDKIIIYQNKVADLERDLLLEKESHDVLVQMQEQLLKLNVAMNRVRENQIESNFEMNERFDRVEDKLNDIQSMLKEMSGLLVEYQYDIGVRLSKVENDEDEYERIMSDFSDTVANKILKKVSLSDSNENYKCEETILKLTFGDSWDKLSNSSKNFLVTAKVIFRYMVSLENVLDYSGVCILVTKALEEEVHKKFYRQFCTYLKSKFSLETEYTKWHTSLYKTYNSGAHVLIPEYDFTLGSVIYICYKRPRGGIADSMYDVNKQRVLEFGKDELFIEGLSNKEIREALREIGDNIDRIRNRYRNPSAHTNELKYCDAKNCFEEVVDIEKILIHMLVKFR
ncbi:hypothetical protein [Clostridium estertheticum]|uniref:hypothetical protein n=1 Tax=Clostridium estertheticum TaxID=238834 RepID=UPI001C0B10E7|nr:hypothetical protein [Clostridium estertheticum]MBU3169906.1 hypothetical protein [Clostridium estertheticum]